MGEPNYSLSDTRLFRETGFLNPKEEDVLLYRVRDITLTRKWHQRIFGVGTICVISLDKTMPHLDIKNVKLSREIKETRRMRTKSSSETERRIRRGIAGTHNCTGPKKFCTHNFSKYT